MFLIDLNLKKIYRSSNNNMVKDFYNPILSCAKFYKRAVGFFTISSLINAAQGLSKLIENGGKVQIIASPKLSKEDIDTILLGYRMKDDVILDAMTREFNDIKSENIREKLNYIATLIADNRLDIKIALMNNYGAYHEKFGIVEDHDGNKIMFTGSMNETENGQYNNFESIVIFKSWQENEKEFLDDYELNFEELWENKTNRLNVQSFPDAVKNKLLEFRTLENKDDKKMPEAQSYNNYNMTFDVSEYPKKPTWFNPRPYQEDAINNWKNNNYNGLLTMATGTGKTLTGLYGVTKLWEEKERLVTIIVCPYQHLVEQWVEDVKAFNLMPVICYSKYPYWKNQVYRKVKLINYGTINNFTIVTTNQTFTSTDMQNFIKNIKCDILLIVDEAHNSGTDTMKRCLDDKFRYRLGLSATPRRFRNEDNTSFIFDFFGGEVFNFDLKRAISENFLTKYYYYPHIVRLTEEEQAQYDELSLKIAQSLKEVNGKIIVTDIAKNFLIKRSRLVAGASEKLNLLRNLMSNYQNKNYILIYCGATKTIDESDDSEMRQIEKVCQILGREYSMKIRKFTSEESPEDRQEIIKMFSDGVSLQGIVAIKCLDEGVNIPAIQHAFIMASNSDPKEFIQRRGRVLRKFDGKEYAYIHDFITVPYFFKGEGKSTLVETELKRVNEFNSLAENFEQGQQFINELANEYNINIEDLDDFSNNYENIGGTLDE